MWLWRSPREESGDTATGGAEPPAEPGYVAVGATLFDTDAEGHPRYRLIAKRIEQPSPSSPIELDSPQFQYQGDTDWTLTADTGVLPPSAQRVTLTGAVLAVAQRPQSAPLRIRTETLEIDLPSQRLDTQAAVSMDWGANRLWATGLHADMKADSVQFQSHAHGEFTRRPRSGT